MQKTKIKDVIYLILLCVTALIVFLVYKAFTDKAQEQASQAMQFDVAEIPMQTYNSDNLDFSLAYPTNWMPEELNETEKKLIIRSAETAKTGQIEIKVYPRDDLNLLPWLEKRITTNGRFALLEDGPITVANISAMYLRLKEGEENQSMIAYVPNNAFVYEIKLIYPKDSDLAYYHRIFNQLADSFKFAN